MSKESTHIDSIRRRVRLVLLLDASREAGIEPLATMRLHLIAYLVNVLSPVWDMPSQGRQSLRRDGSILKLKSGPFYPNLQSDLDSLVGKGIVEVGGLRYEGIGGDHFRLQGDYRVNRNLAKPILSCLYSLPHEAEAVSCVRELVLALSAFSDEEMDRASTQDATYADPSIGVDNVIDFGEWSLINYSRAAAMRVGELVSPNAGAEEKLHLYVRHLRRRLKSGN